MNIWLDRNRLFVLLGALEADLRTLVRNHILVEIDQPEALGPAYSKATERYLQDLDRYVSQAEVLDYLDIGDEIETLNRWKRLLPPSVSEALGENQAELVRLIPIRNRVMHHRPLMPDDFPIAEQALLGLESSGFDGSAIEVAQK